MSHINYFLNKELNIDITLDGNLKIIGLSGLENDLRNQVLKYAKKNKWQIIFELETINKTLKEQYNILWDQATKLADLIDDPESSISWQDRTARVPELQEMIAEISNLEEKLEIDIETVPNGGKKIYNKSYFKKKENDHVNN